MKKINHFFIYVILLIAITGCVRRKVEIGEVSNKPITNNEISLIFQNDSISKGKANFILKNDSEESIVYGEYYEIEINKNGEWYELNEKVDFDASEFTLVAHESKVISINYGEVYSNLAKGKYRLIKKINNNFYIASEFNIN